MLLIDEPDDKAFNTQREALKRYLGIGGTTEKTKPASFPIKGTQLKEIFPGTDIKRCEEVAKLINKYSDKFEINTPLRMAHFLGQVGEETGGFTTGGTAEWTCYSENGNWNIWFNLTWKETPFNTNSCPDAIKGNRKNGWKQLSEVPKKYRCQGGEVSKEKAGKNLFNYVYRCEGGNGGEETQDGYKYRGHGFIHLTWKKQYVNFDKFLQEMGYPSDYKGIISNPDEAFKDMEISCFSGMYYWQKNKCNESADEADPNQKDFEEKINLLSHKVNKQALHQNNREKYFKTSFKILQK